MSDHETIAMQCLRGVRGALTDDQYIDAVERIKTALTRSPAPSAGMDVREAFKPFADFMPIRLTPTVPRYRSDP